MRTRSFVVSALALLLVVACEAKDAPAAGQTKQAEGGEAFPPSTTTEVAKADDAVANPLIGQKAPDFTLTDASGKEHKLADYKGKVVVLEWTEQGCPFVKRHYAAGTMQKLAKSFADKDVVWLAVNSSHFARPDDTLRWARENALSYPVLLDNAGYVGKAYGAKTTPHMFVIDKFGMLRYAGAIDDDPRGEKENRTNHVEQAVSAVLEGKAPPTRSTKPYGCSVKYKAS